MLATAISGSPAINGCELEDLNPKMKRGTVIYLNHKRGRKQRSNLCYRMSMKLTSKENIRAKGHDIFLSQEEFCVSGSFVPSIQKTLFMGHDGEIPILIYYA